MKIPLTSGGAINTDKLNDKEAELYEAINNFYLACEKYNITGFAQILLKDQDGIGALYLPNKTEEMRGKEYMKLVFALGEWLTRTSDDRFYIIDSMKNDDDFPPDKPNMPDNG